MTKPYKVMALSALMAVFAAGNIMPAHTYAAESTVKQAPVHVVAKLIMTMKNIH